jgi:bifunctional non-homologous end joining protein LigD
LTHPDKPYFPEATITKRELAQYYATVARWMLPHLAGRPLSLVRCPDGWSRQCFYQKHAERSVDDAVSRLEVPEGEGVATYFSANSAAALVGLVQWGVIELHPWSACSPRLDRPDRLIFDFDPDEGLAWKELATATLLLRTLLDEMKLTSFLKTTGGKGLHVVLPIRPTLTWEDAKSFTRAVANFLVRTFPDRFTATASKSRRRGRIFIDYLRNAQGATAIVPFGVRARANAPVATPIAWTELQRDVRFEHFNLGTLPKRLARFEAHPQSDPWMHFFETRQAITAAMRERLA